jgi:hypothetical protein
MSRGAGQLGLIASVTPAPAPVRRRHAVRAWRSRGEGARADGAPRVLRLRVYCTRGSLDRRIADAVALEATPALALRARQLAQAPTRCSLAADLRRAVAHAERMESRSRFSAVMLEPARVRAGRASILRLAERLEQATPVSPRGVALARVMLTDASSPLYNRDSERTVTEASCIAEDALVSGPLLSPARA